MNEMTAKEGNPSFHRCFLCVALRLPLYSSVPTTARPHPSIQQSPSWLKYQPQMIFELLPHSDPLQADLSVASAAKTQSAPQIHSASDWQPTLKCTSRSTRTQKNKGDHYLIVGKHLGAGWLLSRIGSLASRSCVLKHPCSFISLLSWCDTQTLCYFRVHMTRDSTPVRKTNKKTLWWLYSWSYWCRSGCSKLIFWVHICKRPSRKNSTQITCD